MKRAFLIILSFLFLLTGCSNEEVGVNIVDQVDLAEPLFIQGLELSNSHLEDSLLYAGLGLTHDSRIVVIDPLSGKVSNITEKNDGLITFPNNYFGEGISFGPEGLYQLTWKKGECFVRDPESGDVIKTFNYKGEGWGLAYDIDKDVFYMTNGSSYVYIRDKDSFEVIDSFDVGVSNLNELEYVDGYLFSNVWKENTILKIKLEEQAVVEIYDLTDISNGENAGGDNVLNGIAHVKDDLFYITGKNWKSIYLLDMPSTK